MICSENGIMPGSQYFFFTPSDIVSKNFYYLLVCGHFYCQTGYYIKRKNHFAPLIMYIKEGTLQVECGESKYTAKKNDIVLIDCRYPHCYYADGTTDFVFFHYKGINSLSITDSLLKGNGSPIFQIKNARSIYNIMNAVITKLYNKQPVSDTEFSCAIHEMLCSLQIPEKIFDLYDESTVAKVTDYINKNISSAITLAELAQQANLSQFYFSKIFKKATGFSPIEYVSKTRIDLAKTMLKTTIKSINEIAIDLGYSSSSSFINAFMHSVGISPNRFRKFSI
jgi:AraC-type DNA-binding domain-containing proteins